MKKSDYLVEIGKIEDFDEAWDKISECLDIDDTNDDVNVLPRVDAVERYIEGHANNSPRFIIGKWIVIFDLSGKDFDYLDSQGLMPYCGCGNSFSEFLK